MKGLFPAATGQVERATVAWRRKSGSPPPISSPITDDEIVDLVKSASSDLPPLASSVGLLPASPAPTAVPPCIPPTTFQEAIEKRQDSKRTVTPKRIAIGGVSGLAVLLVVVVALSHGRPVEREQKQAGNRQDPVAAEAQSPTLTRSSKMRFYVQKGGGSRVPTLGYTTVIFFLCEVLGRGGRAFARIPLPVGRAGIYGGEKPQASIREAKTRLSG